jgi:hypothetical protein
MNSFISSSKAAASAALRAVSGWANKTAAWPWFAGLALGLTGGFCALVLLFAALLEPYDTGRFRLFEAQGVRPQGPRTAAASRGRDAGFNAAIFGNSHMQLLEPAALSAATGLKFVSLTVPATGPKEHLVLIDWFLRNHQQTSLNAASAVVIGMDNLWCQSDRTLPNEKPFPFWLYDANPLRYAIGLMRYDILEELPRRMGYILARKPDRATPDGWWDYEPVYTGSGYDTLPTKRAQLQTRRVTTTMNITGKYPALEQLEVLLQRTPSLTVIAIRPPVFVTGLADQNSEAAKSDTACGDAMAAFAARRARTVFVDWRSERRETMFADFWFDHTHYRKPIARSIERDIVTALDLVR